MNNIQQQQQRGRRRQLLISNRANFVNQENNNNTEIEYERDYFIRMHFQRIQQEQQFSISLLEYFENLSYDIENKKKPTFEIQQENTFCEFKENEIINNKFECNICFDNKVEMYNVVEILPCLHHFCYNCVLHFQTN